MTRPALVAALVLTAMHGALAQGPQGPGGPARPPEDPFARYLVPPELVMQNQQAIALTDRQRAAIQQEMQQAQTRFTDLQWKMNAEGEKLQKLLQGSPIPEGQVLAQVDRILDVERDVKKTHLALLIRIRNALTPEQQAKLETLRR